MERGRLAEERRQAAAAQAVHLSAVEHLRWEPLPGEAPQEEAVPEVLPHIP
jgi:hypothetical protein